MNRAQFLFILNKHKATLDTECEQTSGTLTIDAPKGSVFAANGCHVICEPFSNNGGQSWKPEAYAMAGELVDMGLYNCDDPECEVCIGDND